MSEYLFGRIKLGDVITFRYNSPKKGGRGIFEPPRVVMVLAPNYLGHLHAIKLSGLTPAEQEYIQQLLKVSYGSFQNIFEPLEAQIQQRKKEIDVLNAERNEMLRNGRRVVITPNPPNSQFMDKSKKILGSIIGKVSTFGKTNVQGRQPPPDPAVENQISKHAMLIDQKKKELDQLILNLNAHKEQIQRLPRVPTDPYNYYHMFFKPFIGNVGRMKQIYRKYSIIHISSPRIVKSIGIIPNAR